MKRANIRSLIIAFLLLSALTISGAITEPGELKPGTPNTITLPNGDVVLDLNGEWLAEFEFDFPGLSDIRTDIIKVSQRNNQFVGSSIEGNEVYDKGDVAFRGELGSNGFKKVYLEGIFSNEGALTMTEKISKDGKEIIFKAILQTGLGDTPYIITLKRK